jgi:hypothetical protein
MGGTTGDGIKALGDHAKASVIPTLVSFVAVIIALPPILTGFSAIGIDLIPWASKSTVSKLEREVQQCQAALSAAASKFEVEREKTRVDDLRERVRDLERVNRWRPRGSQPGTPSEP